MNEGRVRYDGSDYLNSGFSKPSPKTAYRCGGKREDIPLDPEVRVLWEEWQDIFCHRLRKAMDGAEGGGVKRATKKTILNFYTLLILGKKYNSQNKI